MTAMKKHLAQPGDSQIQKKTGTDVDTNLYGHVRTRKQIFALISKRFDKYKKGAKHAS